MPVEQVSYRYGEIRHAAWRNEYWSGNADTGIDLPLPACHWFTVSAKLELLDGQPGVHLQFSCAGTTVITPLPMSLKGIINEVVAVPAGASAVVLKPLIADGRFIVHSCQVRPLSAAKRLWRMWRRVGLYFWQTPAAKRAQAAISVSMLTQGLSPVYQRIGQLKACAPQLPYPQWLARFDTVSAGSVRQLKRALKKWQVPASLAVVVYPRPGATAADAEQSALSVAGLYQQFSLPVYMAAETAAVELGRQLAGYQHILLVPAGITLSATALGWWLAPAFADFALCYADHDSVDEDGRRFAPQFKPDWNPELCRSRHYIGGVLRITPPLLLASGWLEYASDEGSYGLLLRLQQQLSGLNTGHIPAVLSHQPARYDERPDAALLTRYFQQQHIRAGVKLNHFGYLDIHYQLAAPWPKVSVIVPTRNMLAVLKPCIDSLLQRTDYPDLEILLIDNQSDDAATLAYMSALLSSPVVNPVVKVLRYDAPFNYSAINNFAVSHATGELVCLLNNDTEVINTDWLKHMVGQLMQKDVGAVGARLLFADRRVQHAGDAIGIGGCAAHMHFRIAAEEAGYMARAVVSQDLSAVTAACLLTTKALYLQLGGLNEQELTVAFNDVDFCLKVKAAGRRIVYTPLAELYHYESVSRGKDDNPVKQRRAKAEAAYMRQRWPLINQPDPFYNPNLNALTPDFRLSAAPAVDKPWQ